MAERFPEPAVQQSIAVDLALITTYDHLLTDLELSLVKTTTAHDVQIFYRLHSLPGVGKILALVLLYEIHDIHRFPRVQAFVSYCRLVTCAKESAGKRDGTSGRRSAMPTSRGRSPKPPSCACATIRRARSTSRASRKNRLRGKP